MDLGDYAATDQSGSGQAILPEILGDPANHSRSGPGAGGSSDEALGRTGLL